MAKARVVVVDPYSSGALLAEALIHRGTPCVAVESSPDLPVAMRSHFDPSVFDEVVSHRSDLDETLNAVACHEPTHVIAGFESGVELAEWLAHHLGLPSNDPDSSELRRDKWAMSEAARSRGLRAGLCFRSADVDELLAWAQGNLRWPVIAKPPRSVASDHVFCCGTSSELRMGAGAILRDKNVLGSKNAAALVQEFLHGTEYAVDTVSCEARHKVTAVWQYHRPTAGDSFIGYDGLRLLPCDDDLQQELCRYTFQLLDAVGVRFGPAHCELMWTGNGPALIEVGARMTAGNNAILGRLCGGVCQLDQTVQAILEPKRFLAHRTHRPQLQKHAANVFLMAPAAGRLVCTRHVSQLAALPTLHSMSIAARTGDEIKGVVGRVTLLHTNWDDIRRDIETIRLLEKDGMFVVDEQRGVSGICAGKSIP